MPTTADEAWRFTDLRGFDPDAFVSNGRVPVSAAGTRPGGTLLEIDTCGVVHVTESSIEVERAPGGITFEPLREHPRLGELVGTDEKFAAHNAAMWEHGLLVH